ADRRGTRRRVYGPLRLLLARAAPRETPHEPDGKRGRQAPAVEHRDPGDRALQRRARPGVPHPPDPAGRRAAVALQPEAGAQRLPGGEPAGVELTGGAAGDAGFDAAQALPAPAGGADAVPVAAGLDAGHEPMG